MLRGWSEIARRDREGSLGAPRSRRTRPRPKGSRRQVERAFARATDAQTFAQLQTQVPKVSERCSTDVKPASRSAAFRARRSRKVSTERGR